MSVLQFGRSRCQIEGSFVPVADISLAAGDGVYFSHELLLWMDRRVTVTARPVPDIWQQILSGMPLMLMDAMGPGHIAFSSDRPGEIIAVPLDCDQAIYVREVVFMVASSQVSYACYDSAVWYTTQNGEKFWPIGRYLDYFYTDDHPGVIAVTWGRECIHKGTGRGAGDPYQANQLALSRYNCADAIALRNAGWAFYLCSRLRPLQRTICLAPTHWSG
jgi:hypothetical protein